jgi:hypothetical protein
MSDRKPVWPWIVALLIGLPAMYVASFGPACWFVSRAPFLSERLLVVYLPLDRVAWEYPESFSETLDWYGSLFMSDEQILWIGHSTRNGDYVAGPHMTHPILAPPLPIVPASVASPPEPHFSGPADVEFQHGRAD